MYEWQSDGSIKIKEGYIPSASFLLIFKPDPVKHLIWWPNFQSCKFRNLEVKRKQCGKIAVRYSCTLLNETCSTKSCEMCTKRIEQF